MLGKDQIAAVLAAEDFAVDNSVLRLTADKDGCRVTVMYTKPDIIDAVAEEIADSPTIIKLVKSDKYGISIEAQERDGKLVFQRKDRISTAELII